MKGGREGGRKGGRHQLMFYKITSSYYIFIILSEKSESVSHSVVSNSLLPHVLLVVGSSVHGYSPARILEWVTMLSSRASSQPRDQTQVYLQCGQILYQLSHQGSPETSPTRC